MVKREYSKIDYTNYDEFIRELGGGTEINDKFKLTRYHQNFILENLDSAENLDEILRHCFQKCVDTTKEKSREENMEADHIGMIISSPLLSSDIWTPMRPVTENTVDAILNLFKKVMQSHADTNMYGEPFRVTVTGINSKALPSKRMIAGRGRRKFTQTINRKINDACIIKVDNNDQYCLFYALELMRLHVSKQLTDPSFRRYRQNFRRQQAAVKEMMAKARIPRNLPEYRVEEWGPIVQAYYDEEYGVGKFKIFVFNNFHVKPIFTTQVQTFTHPIILYHHDYHFDGIKTISKFMASRFYCLHCETPFSNHKAHVMCCKAGCINCGEHGVGYPCENMVADGRFCNNCSKTFYNEDCYLRHLKNGTCNKFKKCLECGVIWNVATHKEKGSKGHECAEKFCCACHLYHVPGNCFIQRYKPKKYKPYRIITYDFESQQVKFENKPNMKIHGVNFVCAKITCTECIANGRWQYPLKEPCDICGDYRTRTWAPFNFTKTPSDRHVVTDDPLSDFTSWLLNTDDAHDEEQLDPNYLSICFAHFGGRYDCTMLFGAFFKRGIKPYLIRQGNKLYEMTIDRDANNPQLIFRDSFNYVSQSLNSLVKAFDLPVEPKMYFPHMYNLEKNYNTVLPHLPPKDDYLYKSKKPKDKEEFEKWYAEHYNDRYDFNEVIAEYCNNDVEILTHALVALRNTFFQITKRNGRHRGIDILYESMTIASACMRAFKLNHLRPNHLAIVPEKGYDSQQNQSLIALKFLAWYSKVNNVKIRTALSEDGEKRMGSYSLDGYIQEQKKGIEVHGCYYHACAKCFPLDQTTLAQGKTAGFIRQKDAKRLEYLRKYLNVEVYYECVIKEMLEKDAKMKKFFDEYQDVGPINFRDCYFGGRTGPMKLYHQVEPGQKISYKDFTSLYPHTNFVTSYPVGHPKVTVIPYNGQDVNWTSATDNPYKGILKVLVVPPQDIKVPVLPIRLDNDERLLFTLCKKCATLYPEGARLHDYKCLHSEEQRQFISTCTHIELNEALEVGYRVKKCYRVVEYTEWDHTVFQGYVQEFMKIKLEASGPPDGCDTSEKLDQFIKEEFDLFGINIDVSNMKYNAALRTLAKICLNSLWGRFLLRNQLSQTIVSDDPYDLSTYFNNPKIVLNDVYPLSKDIFLTTYTPKTEFVEENSSSNVVISLWTTSAARIKLLKSLQVVADTPNCEILYMDTDSIIYVHPENNDPLKCGPHLGDFTDECIGKNIVEYVSGGCKNYALKFQSNIPDASPECSLKIRGFTLDYNTCQLLHYDSFKQKVLDYGTDVDPIVVCYNNFLRPDLKTGSVYTVPMKKAYRPIVTKGIVNNNYQVINYGAA